MVILYIIYITCITIHSLNHAILIGQFKGIQLITKSHTPKTTFTDHASILVVATVVILKAIVSAVYQEGLVACAVCIIQPDGTSPRAEECIRGCRNGSPTTYLPTHHLSIVHVPVIITHRAPLAIMVQLHSALTSVTASSKTHWVWSCRWAHRCYRGLYRLMHSEVLEMFKKK